MSKDLGVDAGPASEMAGHLATNSARFLCRRETGRPSSAIPKKGWTWCDDNSLGIQHIFPAGAIGLDSDPRLLEISRNMIGAMARWNDFNAFSSWYTACARVGYDPKTILAKLRKECDHRSLPNLLLYYGGGGIESSGGLLAINEMLLQSHEGVLRLFPCWPRDRDARFGTLRAVGAFLVSAELKHEVVTAVRIVSEKGKSCTVQNPWPGRQVLLVRNGKRGERMAGIRFTFNTQPNEIIELIAASKPGS